MREHWLTEKELKRSVFYSKPVIKRFSWNNGEIKRIFLLLKKFSIMTNRLWNVFEYYLIHCSFYSNISG